jgi:hypothetical protein
MSAFDVKWLRHLLAEAMPESENTQKAQRESGIYADALAIGGTDDALWHRRLSFMVSTADECEWVAFSFMADCDGCSCDWFVVLAAHRYDGTSLI